MSAPQGRPSRGFRRRPRRDLSPAASSRQQPRRRLSSAAASSSSAASSNLSLSVLAPSRSPLRGASTDRGSALAIRSSQRQLVTQPRHSTVILRDPNRGTMVLLDTVSNTLQVYTKAVQTDRRVCPLCSRPFFDAASGELPEASHYSPYEHVDDYFLLLEELHAENSAGDSSVPSPAYEDAHLSRQAFNDGYYVKFFREQSKIGCGGYGSVFLCYHELDGVNLGHFAVKKIPVGDNRPWLSRVLQEVRSVERVRHPNVVAYKHSWLETTKTADFGPAVPCLFVLMEYANMGNLLNFVDEPPADTFMAESEIQSLVLDVCSGIRHLHHCGIVHRDIKLENLLLTADVDSLTQQRSIRVLISDFGESQSLKRSRQSPRTGNSGTMLYSAPELLLEDLPYDDKVDVYSLGVVLFYMAFRHLPFDCDDMDASGLYERIRESGQVAIPARPKRSSTLIDLILRVMEFDPACRPSIDEVLTHPFFGVSHISPSIPTIDMVVDSEPSPDPARQPVLALSAPASMSPPVSSRTREPSISSSLTSTATSRTAVPSWTVPMPSRVSTLLHMAILLSRVSLLMRCSTSTSLLMSTVFLGCCSVLFSQTHDVDWSLECAIAGCTWALIPMFSSCFNAVNDTFLLMLQLLAITMSSRSTSRKHQ